MKLKLFIAFAMATTMGVANAATTATSSGRNWTYEKSGKECTITGVKPATGSVTIPAKLKNLKVIGADIDLPKTAIATVRIANIGAASHAFYLGEPKQLTLSASVKTIADGSIAHGLKEKASTAVAVAKNNKNFTTAGGVLLNKKKTRLLYAPASKKGAYVVPSTVKTIDSGAFLDCTALTKITLGKNVKTIGERPFPVKASITVAKGNKYFVTAGGVLYNKAKTCLIRCPASKTGALVLPNTVRTIKPGAFSGCTKITSLTLGKAFEGDNDIWNWGDFSGFGDLTGLKTFKVAAGNASFKATGGVLYSKDGVFLIKVPAAKGGMFKFPASCISVGGSAFDGCSKLKTIALPKESANISTYGSLYVCGDDFRGCTSLVKFTVDAGNQDYKAVSGVLFGKNWNTGKFTELVAFPSGKKGAYKVPSSTTSIGASAFSGATGLTKVTIGAKISTISSSTFAGCARLASVTLPSTLTSINAYAFSGCKKLTSLTVPAKVSYIGAGAFDNTGLKKLVLPNKLVCTLSEHKLPASCKVTYTTKTGAYWIKLVSGGYVDTVNHTQGYTKNGYNSIGWSKYGSVVRQIAYRGKAIKLPTCFEAWGNTFKGWATKTNTDKVTYKAGASVKNLAAEGKTATLYAVWAPNTTTFKFNANGGTGSASPIVVKYGDWAESPYENFRRDGYWFDGWNTKPDGSGEYYWSLYADGEKSETVTLYAQWWPDEDW